jgi:hypothetical protein
MNSRTQERKFDKSKSVFALWAEDTPNTPRRVVDHDFNYWKIRERGIVKPREDLENCELVIEENLPVLKHMAIFMQSSSAFPGITQEDFTNWIKDWKVLDYITGGEVEVLCEIDLIYTAAVRDMEKKGS